MPIPIIGQGIKLIEGDEKKRAQKCLKAIKEALNGFDCLIVPQADVLTADDEYISILGKAVREVIDNEPCETAKFTVQKLMVHVIAKPRNNINLTSLN